MCSRWATHFQTFLNLNKFLFFLVITGCAKGASVDSSSITATPSPSNNISVLSTSTISNLSLDVSQWSTSNIIYDGTRILFAYRGNNLATMPLYSIGFNYQSTTNASVSNIDSILSLSPYLSGQSVLAWSTIAGAINLQKINNSDGSGISSSTFNPSNYGCNGGPKLTFCGGSFYGVCSTNSGNFKRFFSMGTNGAIQDAVSVSNSAINANLSGVEGITCYQNNSLLVYSGPNFYKFDLNFNLITSDPATFYYLSSSYSDNWFRGLASDGDYLYFA